MERGLPFTCDPAAAAHTGSPARNQLAPATKLGESQVVGTVEGGPVRRVGAPASAAAAALARARGVTTACPLEGKEEGALPGHWASTIGALWGTTFGEI